MEVPPRVILGDTLLWRNMAKSPTPLQMMDAHIAFNLGIYFDSSAKIGDGFDVASSEIIKDFYWNFAFSRDGSPSTQGLDNSCAELRRLGRQPALWQCGEDKLPFGWGVRSCEAWMWLDGDDWQRPSTVNDSLKVSVVEVPSGEMVSVFKDAYSSAGEEGDVGYSALSLEYVRAFELGRSRQPVISRYFAVYVERTCVGIGTASVWNGIGGIYSIATSHSYRRRGIGRAISIAATEWALSQGACGVMLQTEADSPVERMYQQIGYKRTHIGILAVLE